VGNPNELIFTAIGQTGQIPASARAIIFYADTVPIQVSFGGQILPVFHLDDGIVGYHPYGADVSSFAGQTAELRFTGIGGGSLDFIQFSSQAIPEPDVPALSVLGAGLLGWLWRKCARERSKAPADC
jgi:hypothetical protein